MFTYMIYNKFLLQPEVFWASHHLGMLWGLAILFDLMLALVLYVAVNAALASGTGSNATSARERLLALSRTLVRLDRLILVIAGVFLAAMVLTTFISVTGRAIYRPIPDDITLAEWFMVAVVALMLGTIQGREEHIEVTAISDTLSYRFNLWLRLLGLVIGILAVGRLGYVAVDRFPGSFLEITYGSIYQLPVWPARFVFAVGIGWWLARIAMQFVLMPAAIRSWRRSDVAWLDLSPLISRDGMGEPEAVEAVLDLEANSEKRGDDRGA
ncbi:MAG: TRAP transporter small permease subunit [Pararhodobacter sp.]|nr:TRAP transporter small permease subunit [Pararhodobacter sp.]